MEHDLQKWLDDTMLALADARAMLASFGVRDRVLEAQIDGALSMAHALKGGARQP